MEKEIESIRDRRRKKRKNKIEKMKSENCTEEEISEFEKMEKIDEINEIKSFVDWAKKRELEEVKNIFEAAMIKHGCGKYIDLLNEQAAAIEMQAQLEKERQ